LVKICFKDRKDSLNVQEIKAKSRRGRGRPLNSWCDVIQRDMRVVDAHVEDTGEVAGEGEDKGDRPHIDIRASEGKEDSMEYTY